MDVQPFILGRGMSALAIRKALSIIDIVDPEIDVREPVQLQRSQPLGGLVTDSESALLCIGNPHGLHAQAILEGEEAGFRHIVAEKPACVTAEDIPRLRGVSSNVAVLHGYRQMWGTRAIKSMIDRGDLGELLSIEGRYWQSGAAQLAFDEDPPNDKAWKNDNKLNGPYDAVVDIGSHWIDLVIALAGERPQSTRLWLSYMNAPAPHRDTHVHAYLEFSSLRSMGSVSRTCHGHGNEIDVTVIGKERSASWSFARPDEVKIGRGREMTVRPRKAARYGSQQPPFHGVGWLEGYTEIIHNFLIRKSGREADPVPTLEESLVVMDVILNADRL